MAARADRAGRGRAEDREAIKVRRQKIFVAVAGVVLLGLVGFQLPGLFGSSQGSGSPSPVAGPAPTGGVAVPITSGGPLQTNGSSSPISRSIRRLDARDVFAPQVSAVGGLAAPTAGGGIAQGPAVRASGFVAKDVFAPQITVPDASPASSSPVASAAVPGSSAASARPFSGGS